MLGGDKVLEKAYVRGLWGIADFFPKNGFLIFFFGYDLSNS